MTDCANGQWNTVGQNVSFAFYFYSQWHGLQFFFLADAIWNSRHRHSILANRNSIWMENYRQQSKRKGEKIITFSNQSNTGNFVSVICWQVMKQTNFSSTFEWAKVLSANRRKLHTTFAKYASSVHGHRESCKKNFRLAYPSKNILNIHDRRFQADVSQSIPHRWFGGEGASGENRLPRLCHSVTSVCAFVKLSP